MKRGLSTGDITGLVDENDSSFTKVRNGHKKPPQKSRLYSTWSVPTTAQSEIAELRRTVERLSTVVSNQKAMINNLHNKLKFVLSFLDISDCGPDPVRSDTATASGTIVVEGSVQQHADAVVDTSMSVVDTNAAVQQSSQATNHSVTSAVNRESNGLGPPSSLRYVVAAVVYADQRDREKRARTVIVSGLAPSLVDGDALIFQRLCFAGVQRRPVGLLYDQPLITRYH